MHWKLLLPLLSTISVQGIHVAQKAQRMPWPRFSWDHPPVFFQSCNESGPFSDEAINTISKFPVVTIEKCQGRKDFDDKRYVEDKVIDELQRIKQKNSSIFTVFYYHSVLDLPGFRLHEEFMAHPDWWLKRPNGTLCMQNGESSWDANGTQKLSKNSMLVFDFKNPEVRDFWERECLNITTSDVVDGCFADQAIRTPCHAGTHYDKGHRQALEELQEKLTGGLLIGNRAYDLPGLGAVMLERFQANESSINTLVKAVADGKMVFAHAGYQSDGRDNHCWDGVTNSLAAFLIGAGPNSYYMCSRGWTSEASPIDQVWHPEYDRKLGIPLADAIKTGDTYYREFHHATGITKVRFNTTSNVGRII